MKAWISSLDPRDLVLRAHLKGWDQAMQTVEVVRAIPPPGYRMMEAKIAKEGSGQRLSLTLTLRHTDRREEMLTRAAGLQYLDSILLAAAS